MKCEINDIPIEVRSDCSYMQVRRKYKNHKNEYIVTSYIYTDKELNDYDKEKISDWITNRINRN